MGTTLERWLDRLPSRRIRFVYLPPDTPLGVHRVYIRRGNEHIGKLLYRVCDECKLGLIGKVSIRDDYQRQGLGKTVIRQARERVPGYRWATSWQYPSAESYWAQLAEATGGGEYRQDGSLVPAGCRHMP